MKIEVKGHEYEVLLGSKIVIERCKPIIYFEQQEKNFLKSIKSRVMSSLTGLDHTKFIAIRNYPRIPARLPPVIRYAYGFS